MVFESERWKGGQIAGYAQVGKADGMLFGGEKNKF